MSKTNNPQRVAVFIDHSNVLHRLFEMRKIGSNWETWYDPFKLAMHLVGNRDLVGTYFYCAPPPSYLLKDSERQYWKQMSYYEKIRKHPYVILKFAKLAGSGRDVYEKNLDTQMSADIILQATRNEFDTAIVVSNDGDYVAAVDAAKKLKEKGRISLFQR